MWQVKIHRLVLEEDFRKIPEKKRSEILKTIYKKLGSSPEQFGAPLRHKGLRKLRIGEYRAVYRIEKKVVRVLALKVGIRWDSEVYKEMRQWLQKAGD